MKVANVTRREVPECGSDRCVVATARLASRSNERQLVLCHDPGEVRVMQERSLIREGRDRRSCPFEHGDADAGPIVASGIKNPVWRARMLMRGARPRLRRCIRYFAEETAVPAKLQQAMPEEHDRAQRPREAHTRDPAGRQLAFGDRLRPGGVLKPAADECLGNASGKRSRTVEDAVGTVGSIEAVSTSSTEKVGAPILPMDAENRP